MKRFACIAAMALTAQARDAPLIDLSALTESQAPFQFDYGQQVKITGVENRSTGYRWMVTNDCGARFELMDDTYGYEELEGTSYGRQGRRNLIYKTASADSNSLQGAPCDLVFSYQRPWEGPENAAEVKKVTVVVGQAPASE